MKQYLVGIFLLAILSGCTPKHNTFINNPNGSSELALLMNQMYSDLYGIKKNITKGKRIKYKGDYSKLLTATPTDETMKNDVFEPFANALLHNVDALNMATIANQRSAYETVVQTCISCHNQSCPGPLMRIENLVIKD